MVEMQILEKIMNAQLTEAHFEALLEIVDRMHDAAAVDGMASVSTMDKREMIGWLDDIIYTAAETIRELEDSLHSPTTEKNWSDN